MNELLIALIIINIGQLSLLWYKIGRVERKLDDHCRGSRLWKIYQED